MEQHSTGNEHGTGIDVKSLIIGNSANRVSSPGAVSQVQND